MAQGNVTSTFSGGADDNPWDTLRTSENGGAMQVGRAEETVAEVRETSCGLRVLRTIVQVCLFLDMVVGIILITYYQWMKAESADTKYDIPRSVLAVYILWGSLLASRAMLGVVGLTENPCKRFALWMASILSFPTAFFYAVLCIKSWTSRQAIRELLTKQWMFPQFAKPLRSFLSEHFRFLWVILLVLAIWECCRWQLFQQYEYCEVFGDDDVDEDMLPLYSSTSRQSRPWWWSSTPRNEMTQSLLSPGLPQWVSNGMNQSYEESLGNGERRRRRRRKWFSSPFGFSSAEDGEADNTRDDGSVDFASVQEEWASRTEEDPLWWSREETESNIPSSRTPAKEPDTSWANETTL